MKECLKKQLRLTWLSLKITNTASKLPQIQNKILKILSNQFYIYQENSTRLIIRLNFQVCWTNLFYFIWMIKEILKTIGCKKNTIKQIKLKLISSDHFKILLINNFKILILTFETTIFESSNAINPSIINFLNQQNWWKCYKTSTSFYSRRELNKITESSYE